MSDRSVAIVGATGAVGTEMLRVLEKREFPVGKLKLLASSRSAGRKLAFRGEELAVEELGENSFQGVELALFSAGGAISRKFAPLAVASGAVVVDNSSVFRMDDNVPLVVPEVNAEDIKEHQGIIANPNCSTIIMVVPLWPLHQRTRIKRVVCATYQAASGAGARAMQELEDQTRAVLAGEPVKAEHFPAQLAFNVITHNWPIGENGYSQEELKMVHETRKLFHEPRIAVTATTVRVPVLRAHSEAINIQFTGAMPEADARQILAEAPGVEVVDDREANRFPMPIDAAGRDEILVGRIRQDISQHAARGLDLFVSGDQLLKGAALNAVQIAELL